MNRQQVTALYELTRSVRRLFHQLGARVGALHAGADVSAGMRAILETLTERGPMTVPDMARLRPVTRQHIQSLVNPLLDLGYVEAGDNPAHRRSKLIAITPEGERVFQAMRARENDVFRQVDLGLDAAELRAANEVLLELVDVLDGDSWQSVVEPTVHGPTTGSEHSD